MKNVQLIPGKCPICGGGIDERWAGKNPTIGTTCRNCYDRKDELFGPENVEIVVQKQVVYNPLFGKYEYHFDWRGTKVMINGKVGEIQSAYLGSCTVKFPGGEDWGDSVSTLDYWRLKKIYQKTGGEMEPPPFNPEPHVPTKAPLLDAPILAVDVKMKDDGEVWGIQVGRRSIHGGLMFQPHELEILPILHAFCNLFVRYKFGLAPNFACEGGFHGRDFEVRNAGTMTGGCGLTVTMNRIDNLFKYVDNEKDFRAMAVLEGLIGMTVAKEESRPGVLTDASAHEVLSVWVNIMETLLKYDWTKAKYGTVEDMWKNYCTMQDILLNVLAPVDLKAALEYAKKGEMVHAGSSY